MDKKKLQMVGIGIIGAMALSLAAIAYSGVGPGEKSLPLLVFSSTIAAGVMFFDGWFKEKG